MKRYKALFAIVCILMSPSLGNAKGDDQAHEDDVASVFRTNCMNCHTFPSLEFATDQAWLKQIKSTA